MKISADGAKQLDLGDLSWEVLAALSQRFNRGLAVLWPAHREGVHYVALPGKIEV